MAVPLMTDGLSVQYGGVRALVDVTLEVRQSQLVGLIGPNGAGKTTLIDAITGFTAATGRVLLAGEDIARESPYRRARRGLVRTWQSSELFDALSVRENLSVPLSRHSLGRGLREIFLGRSADECAIDSALAAVGLADGEDVRVDELSEGRRKLVGLARAVAGRPQVLCLDEPAAGLDPRESEDLGRRLRAIVDAGTPMLLIDHDMSLILSICDYVYVLDFGELISQGTPSAVQRDPRVIEAYLGGVSDDRALEAGGRPADAPTEEATT